MWVGICVKGSRCVCEDVGEQVDEWCVAAGVEGSVHGLDCTLCGHAGLVHGGCAPPFLG